MKEKLYLERIIATMSICAVMMIAFSLGLVAVCEYHGVPYVWPWTKIAMAAVMLVAAALGMTFFAVRATNLLVPEVCCCEAPSSVDGVCNECSFRIPE